ncbi:hypothetical protein C2S52_021377 [Perilla frutescens var. hirtella]|nr:hypothetical protein C2S52_021377 [Perilla frutescens var. hirtella]
MLYYNKLYPEEANKRVGKIIKAKYDRAWNEWSENDDEIFQFWESKGATVIRQSFADIRRGKCKGRWLASNKLEVKLGKKVSIPEVFESLNYDKQDDKWLTSHSEMLYHKFKEMKEDSVSQGKDINDSKLFFETAGGTNRHGRCAGFGSEVSNFATSSGSRNKSKCSQSSTAQDEHLMNDRLNRLEDTNKHLLDVNERLTAEVVELRNLILQKNNTGTPYESHSSAPFQ